MKTIKAIFTFLILSSSGFSQYTNVMISDLFSPNEPVIIMDSNQPGFLIAAANLNSYYISLDTGLTWVQEQLISDLGVWGDPVLVVDSESNLYYFHLSNPYEFYPEGDWIDRIVCQKSENNGASWLNGTFTGLNPPKDQDKEWAVVDLENDNIYLTWTQFDAYGSSNPLDSSIILFSKSTDAGSTWSEPLRINQVAGDCIDSDNTVEGAVPAVGPNGEIYVAWAGPEGLVFDRSLDQGETWLAEDIIIDSIPDGWDYAIPGIYRANGLPITKCDLSGGPNNGTIYVNWTDQRNGEDDTDVFFSKSTDGGDTWSETLRVNDDEAGKQQFLTWMTIDQITGFLYFVFYDRRNHDDNYTDVYMARSTDGGETFTNFQISESAFLPNEGVFFGDYTNIAAHDGKIRPIWTRLHNGQLTLWTAIVNFSINTGVEENTVGESFSMFQNYPNPSEDEVYFSFKLKKEEQVSLRIYDPQGKLIAEPIVNETYSYGKHVITFPFLKYGLAKGVYYYQIELGDSIKSDKIIFE